MIKRNRIMQDRKTFYKKLKSQLDDTTKFPADYLYKFIVPAGENKSEKVKTIFDNKGAIIDTKKSKTGKYTSISIRLHVKSSDEIINYYKEAEKIKGIISL